MQKRQLDVLLNHFSAALGLSNQKEVSKSFISDSFISPTEFIQQLREYGEKKGLLVFQKTLSETQLRKALEDNAYPLAYLYQVPDGEPRIIVAGEDAKTGKRYVYEVGATSGKLEELDLPPLPKAPNEEITVFTAFPLQSISEESRATDSKPLRPMERLFRMLGTERKDIVTIYVYAVFIGAISLTLPLGIQAIIGLVQGGLVFSSIYILIGLVILALSISGIMQVMQLTVVEHLRERLFAKAAFDFTYRIPRIKAEALFKYYPPELMNRFFDIVTVQKALPKLLIDLTAAVMQIIFGLILLAIYHPIFIAFSLLTFIVFYIIVRLFGKKTLDASITKSKYKYKVAQWLQDIARTLHAFKVAGNPHFTLQKTELHVSGYLKYRKKYFENLLVIYYNAVFFKAFVTGGLLIIGTYLVVDRQITIGQFVASEIIVVLVVGAVEKLLLGVDTVFDILTGVDKLGTITDLPLEKHQSVVKKLPAVANGIQVSVHGLTYRYEDELFPILNQLNLEVKPQEKVCLTGTNGSGKDTLLNVLAGIYTNFGGRIQLNNIPIQDIAPTQLHQIVERNVAADGIFDGTLLENITLNRENVKIDYVYEVLNALQMMPQIAEFPNGLSTQMISAGRRFSTSFSTKITIARCLVSRPQLLLLSNCYGELDDSYIQRMWNYLNQPEHRWSIITASNSPLVMKACDRVCVLEKGSIIAEGTYDSLLAKGLLPAIKSY